MKSSSSGNKLDRKPSLDDTQSTTAESSSSWSSQEFSLERSDSFSSSSCGGGSDSSKNNGGSNDNKKAVRFAPETDVYAHPSRSEYTQEDRGNIWWSPAEMARKHERAAASAAKILKSEAGGGNNNKKKKSSSSCSCLDEIINNAMYIHTTTDHHEEFAILARDEQFVAEHTECLVAWTHREHNGRGLEPYLSNKFGEYQGGWMVASRSAVVEMSLMMRNKPFSRDVAENYRELSRTSFILARLMAEADAIAAARYQTSSCTRADDEETVAPPATIDKNKNKNNRVSQLPSRPLFSKQSSGGIVGKFARSLQVSKRVSKRIFYHEIFRLTTFKTDR